MNKYELMVIVKGELTDEVRKKEVDKIKDFLTKEKAGDIKVDVWGIKKFAYPINYKNEGFYAVFNFDSAPEVPGKLTAVLKVNENLVRYMFVSRHTASKKPASKPKPAAEKAKKEVKEIKE